MDANNKYYTPEIEEFCVGFEFEVNHKRRDGGGNRDWCKEKFRMSQEDVRFTKYLLENEPDNIRVKYLDKQDIEECGLVLWQIPCDSFDWEFYISHNDVSIGSVTFNDDASVSELELFGTLFHVKNKTELKKLLKMLNINI